MMENPLKAYSGNGIRLFGDFLLQRSWPIVGPLGILSGAGSGADLLRRIFAVGRIQRAVGTREPRVRPAPPEAPLRVTEKEGRR